VDAYEDFTFDPVRFPPAEMAQWVDSLHQNNQYYVLITGNALLKIYIERL
jgi:alpha-glucosidase (family GH31 glycosyl hydrolase)